MSATSRAPCEHSKVLDVISDASVSGVFYQLSNPGPSFSKALPYCMSLHGVPMGNTIGTGQLFLADHGKLLKLL